MTDSPASGLPSEETIARHLCQREGHDPDIKASWVGDDLLWTEWLDEARAVLSLIRPAFEAKEREIEVMRAGLNREREAHRETIRQMAAINAAAEAKLAQAVVFDLGGDITVESRGNGTWAVKNLSNVLNSAGEWEWEPRPSGRDDDFIARTRFPLDEAFRRAAGASLAETR